MTAAAIRLSPIDNVAVCCRAVSAGEVITVDGHAIVVAEPIDLGHKLAIIALQSGDKVLKYGMPIGSMTASAPEGGWVHLHNMKSDYMPAHMRDAAGDQA